MVFAPMRLYKDAVDLFELDGAGLVSDRFNETADGQVAGPAEDAFAGTDDQGQSFLSEGVMAQAGAIELIEEKPFDGFR